MSPHYWTDTALACFGVVIFFVGIILYMVPGWHRAKFSPSKFWPSVVGTITASALEKTKNKKIYAVAVRYRYRVAGKDYESDRVFWGPQEGPEKEMAAVVATYPVGRDVWVQHDRKDAANAVLEPARNTAVSGGIYFYGIALMGMGLAALGLGLYALSH
jgi:Protein of unknown function (DUF3592)